MPMFQWEGKTRDGAVRTGVIAAENDQVVIAQLKEQNIMATKVKAKSKDIEEYLIDNHQEVRDRPNKSTQIPP